MPSPTSPSDIPEPDEREDLPQPILAAIEALALETGISPDNISLVRYSERQWPTTALGCPRPGFSYAQVVTDGYEVHLEADGNTYQAHTDLRDNVVLCSDPEGLN